MAIFNTTYTTTQGGGINTQPVLSIATPPSKVDYYIGDTFSPNGMVVKGVYENGMSINISHDYLTFSPSGELDKSIKTIAVNFKSGDIDQTLYQPISVTTRPTWWSPEMTSNNTPAPYVASALSSFQNCAPYMAFNTLLDNNTWSAIYGSGLSDWIQIDFGREVTLHSFRMTSKTSSFMPSTFIVYGLSSTEYVQLLRVSDVTGYEANTPKEFELTNKVPITAFKIVFPAPTGYTQLEIGSIEFYGVMEETK